MSYAILIQVQSNGRLVMKYMPNEEAALELLKETVEKTPSVSAAVVSADVVTGGGFRGAMNCDVDGSGLEVTGIRVDVPALNACADGERRV